jgi:hypothetical protein
MLFCGMALGYMDEQAPANKLRTERAKLEEFATLRGFGDVSHEGREGHADSRLA